MIDQASVFAERYKSNPQVLQATVLGQGGDPHLDPYTALRALQLIKESNQMAMARQAQQPTSAPSILSDAMTPAQPPAMPMGAPVGMGARALQAPMPQAPAPQAPVMQASGGLASMHVPEEHYAGGGILAFSGQDRADDPFGQQINTDDQVTDDQATDNQTQGSQSALDQLNAYILDYLKKRPASAPPPTASELSAMRAQFLKEQEEYAGPNIYAPAQADQTAREEARKANMGQMSGLALLNAAGAVLKGHSLGEGLSNAAPAYASTMAEAIRADQAEKRAIEQMNFNLADAQRKERVGNFRAANEAMENYRKSVADANRAKAESDRADALLAGRAAAANRAPAKGAGQPPANVQLRDSLAAQYIRQGMSEVDANAKATRDILAAQGTKTITSTGTPDFPEGGPRAKAAQSATDEKVNAKVSDALDKWKKDASIGLVKDPNMIAYKNAIKAKDMATANAILKSVEADIRARFNSTAVPPTAPRASVPPPAGFVPDRN